MNGQEAIGQDAAPQPIRVLGVLRRKGLSATDHVWWAGAGLGLA